MRGYKVSSRAAQNLEAVSEDRVFYFTHPWNKLMLLWQERLKGNKGAPFPSFEKRIA